MDLARGQQLGKWTLVKKLGRGAEGEVWKAEHSNGEHAALKIGAATGPLFYEATMVRAVGEAPGLCHLVGREGIDEARELKWLPMELMDTDLTRRVHKDGPLSGEALGRVARAMVRALQHVHAKGYVFRDVSPNNILLRGDEVKLADFGCVVDAKCISSTAFEGTPSFAPIAAFDAQRPSPRDDLESLAYVLHWAGGGELPWSDQKVSRRTSKKAMKTIAAERKAQQVDLERMMSAPVAMLLQAARDERLDYDHMAGLF